MSERCETCRFWMSHNIAGYTDRGACRRFPPTLLPMRIDQLYTDEDTDDQFDAWQASRNPVTDSDDWCGEWQPK